jgi:hypothetical protein
VSIVWDVKREKVKSNLAWSNRNCPKPIPQGDLKSKTVFCLIVNLCATAGALAKGAKSTAT